MNSIVELLLMFLVGLFSNVQDDSWPRFRGPQGNSVANESLSLPSQWDREKHLAWRSQLPGPGASSPIVVDDQVFVTCYSGYGIDRQNPGDVDDLFRHLICLDLKTGKLNWQRKVKASLPEDLYDQSGVSSHGYASHTPVSDGVRVFCFFGKSGVHAFDLKGNALWNAETGRGSDPPKWGSSASPIVYEDTLIVTASAESQSVIGIDTVTGQKKWQWKSEELQGMWGTPSMLRVNSQRVDLVMMIPGQLLGMNPKDGTIRWRFMRLNSRQAYTSIVHQKDQVFAFAGQPGGSIALRVGENEKQNEVVWTSQVGATYGSPVLHRGKIYVISRSLLSVVSANSGQLIDKHRLKETRRIGNQRFGSLDYASPVIAGDRLFWLSPGGQVFVFRLGPGEEIEPPVINDLASEKGEIFWGTPAISKDRLLIRSSKAVYCLTGKK